MIKDVLNVQPIEAVTVTLFSMGIVFICLIAISYLIDLMRITLNKKRKEEEKVKEPKAEEVPIQTVDMAGEDDTELAAVITAAISALTGTKTSGIKIRNIKRLPDTDTAWSRAGKAELMR